MQMVDVENFFGRKAVLDLLKKRVLDLKEGYRQNVALLGRHHIGKTVLLQKLITNLDDEKIVPVYLDMENQDLQDLYAKIAGRLLYYYAKRKGLPVSDNVKALIEVTHGDLPATSRCIKKIQALLAHDKSLEAFREIIALPQIFSQEFGVFSVLFLDEFHALEELPVPGVFQELGKKIMTQTRCLYVVASSRPAAARKILMEKLSLLFGNFELLELDVFDPESSRDFSMSFFKEMRIKEPLRNFLVDFTGGHPLFLNLLCREIVSLGRVYGQTDIFAPLISQALENLLFQPWGILNGHFNLLIDHLNCPKGNITMGRLLLALAGGRQKIQEILRIVGMKQSQLRPQLQYLVDQGVVVKNGSFYYLEDKLFRFWLNSVFQHRHNSFDFDPQQRLEQFRARIAQSIDQFSVSLQKDLPTRIMELLFCFEDETCTINGRRYRLPVFREIVPARIREMPGAGLDIIRASTEEGEWFVVLTPQPLCENDINAILAETKKNLSRPRKCILISLKGMDENVRIRALQERMWIWNEEELNALLNIYNKPYIL